MNLFKDICSGWQARPAASSALALIGLFVGLLSSVGFRTWSQAELESRRLLQAWPPERTTLAFSGTPDADEAAMLLERLPPGDWWSWEIHKDVVWVKGTLPPEYVPQEGSPLQSDHIRRGMPVGLADPSTPWRTGEVGTHQGIAFEIIGKTQLPESASVMLPATLRFEASTGAEKIEVRVPADQLRQRIADLPFYNDLSLLDHRQKREEARVGFRRLTLQLSILAGASALLVALILQTVVRLELKERRFEFALRRSVGARPSDIRTQILTESFCTAGLPALVGVLVLMPTLPGQAWLLVAAVPGWFVLSAIPPACHAAALPPHEALKEG